MNQLHESGGCVDLSSNTCLNRWRIYLNSTVFIGIASVSMHVVCSVRIGTSFLKCKGMREYVWIPLYLPLAREVVAFLACAPCKVSPLYSTVPRFFHLVG